MNKPIQVRVKIMTLLMLMILLVSLLFAIVEITYLKNYRQTLRDTAETITNFGINQVYQEINQLWYELSLISSTIMCSEEVQRYIKRDADMDTVLSPIRFALSLSEIGSEKIDSIILTDFQSPPLFAYGQKDMAVLEDARRVIYEDGQKIFSPTHFFIKTRDDGILYCINFTNTPDQYPEHYIIIIYNIKSISRMMEAVDAQYGTMLALFDSSGDIVISNNDVPAENYPDTVRHLSIYDVSVPGHEVRRLARMNMHLGAYIDDNVPRGNMTNLYTLTSIINGILIVMFIVFLLLIQQQIHDPIRQIIRFMENRPQNPHTSLHLKTHNEISTVAGSLNQMLLEIHTAAQENLRIQEQLHASALEQKRAENASLMSQSNPHFLYNTLDCIRGIALVHSEKDIAGMVDALAYILRYSIKGGATASVIEEIQSIRQYMEIISVRHNGRIRIREELAPEIMDCLMPKMILQPIVENAVFHGLEPVSRDGTVTIYGRMENSSLIFVIQDDGKGMTQEELRSLRSALQEQEAVQVQDSDSGHIGLRNIHRRLCLMFNEPNGIEIDSIEDVGTRIFIRFRTDLPNTES